jgi:hypothetical protein
MGLPTEIRQMIWNLARSEDIKFGGSSSRDVYIIYDDHRDKDLSHNEGSFTAWPLLLVSCQVHHEVSSLRNRKVIYTYPFFLCDLNPKFIEFTETLSTKQLNFISEYQLFIAADEVSDWVKYFMKVYDSVDSLVYDSEDSLHVQLMRIANIDLDFFYDIEDEQVIFVATMSGAKASRADFVHITTLVKGISDQQVGADAIVDVPVSRGSA